MHVTKEFVLAGDAIFTIEVGEHKGTDVRPHYTYRVQLVHASKEYPTDAYFVRLLCGPDNTRNYKYLGKLNHFTGEVSVTGRGLWDAEQFCVKLVNKVLARVWADDHEAYEKHGYKTHHENKCCRCARLLTTPESVERGIGPECMKIMAGA